MLGQRVKTNYDVVVIGGGPAGLSFACLAGRLDLKVAVVDTVREEQLAAPAIDGRDIALTHRSVQVLERLGVWGAIPPEEVAPIRRACVLNADQSQLLHFDPPASRRAELGYLVSNHILRTLLYREAKKVATVELIAGVEAKDIDLGGPLARVSLASGNDLEAPLVVAADSRFSKIRRQAGIGAEMRDFGRTCIVCRMKHEKAHDGTAYEWFDKDWTLAVLPLSDRLSSIVITQPASVAAETSRMPASALAAQVAEKFAGRWGPMELVGERHSYPLVAVYAERFATRHLALIGDAAVGMHPVTAHGFNFGLMGAQTLVTKVHDALRSGMNIAAPEVLEAYDREHRRATYPLYAATNALVRLYTDNRTLARVARSAILRIGERLTPIKDLMLRRLTAVDETLTSTREALVPRGVGDHDREARSRP